MLLIYKMLFATCKWVIISLTLIVLIHSLYRFLLNTLTVPKLKDLVNKPNEQYKDIFASLHTSRASINVMEPNDDKKMTDELTSFLKELKKPNDTNINTNTTNNANNNVVTSYTDILGETGFSQY